MSTWHGEQRSQTNIWHNVQYLNPIPWLLTGFWATVFALIWSIVGAQSNRTDKIKFIVCPANLGLPAN
jgi:hypothetical protein